MNFFLLTTMSRKVISFSDISAVNLMLGWNKLALFNKMIQVFFYHCPRGTRYRQYIDSILFSWFYFAVSITVVSILAMKILTNDTAILVPMAVPCNLR